MRWIFPLPVGQAREFITFLSIMIKKSFFKHSLLFLILLGYLSLVYLPALTNYYAHHDEYQFFINDIGANRHFPFFYGEFSLGRYLSPYIYEFQEARARNIADLNLLRFQTVVNVSLCGV